MKKTLIAVAALSAMAASAMAADVTLYGQMDYGVKYNHTKTGAGVKADAVSMTTGMNGATMYGVKGTEQVGPVKVSFVLEGGFNCDDGKNTAGTPFNRQSELDLSGAFGTFRFGRMGVLTGGTSGGVMLKYASGFGTSNFGCNANADYVFDQPAANRIDNSVRYDSPVFAGFQFMAQYSDNALDAADEGLDRNVQTKYLAAALKYENGPVSVAVCYGQSKGADTEYAKGYTMLALKETKDVYENEDAWKNEEDKVTASAGDTYWVPETEAADGVLHKVYDLGVTWNAGFAKFYGLYQHATKDGVKSNSYSLGADVPLCGGTAMLEAGLKDGETADKFHVAAGYKYSFSKRTSVWTAVGYSKDDADKTYGELKTLGVSFGLIHAF